MSGPEGRPCYEPAEVKLTDSWGDTAWSCLRHAEQALLAARGVFLAGKDPEGLTAYMARMSRAIHPDPRKTNHP